MSHVEALRQTADAKRGAFLAAIDSAFPGMAEWHWYRALAHVRGRDGRRNDDTSNDLALAANETIRQAHDAYIQALHAFYRARDGEKGFLGSRGL